MPKTYSIHCETAVFNLTWGVSRATHSAGHTGRAAEVTPLYGIAQRWVTDFERDGVPRAELEQDLVRSLSPAQLSGLPQHLFRGQWLADAEVSVARLGPPPSDIAHAGRYNLVGEPVIYLCSSIDGVARELEDPADQRQLWVQSCCLPPTLRIADAQGVDAASLAAAAFLKLEAARDRDAHFRLGPRLRQVIEAAGYDGFIVPGVRGSSKAFYSNVVIFRADRWPMLIDQSVAPFVAR